MSGVIGTDLVSTSSLLMAVLAALHAQSSASIDAALALRIPNHDREIPLAQVNSVIRVRALPLAIMGTALPLLLLPPLASVAMSTISNLGGRYEPMDAAFIVVTVMMVYFGFTSWRSLLSLSRKRAQLSGSRSEPV